MIDSKKISQSLRLHGGANARLVFVIVCLAAGKYLLRFVGTDGLYLLLWPTSMLVQAFTGIDFAWIPGVGFRGSQGIVIESSCSGAGFFILSVALGAFHLLSLPVKRILLYLPAFVMLGYVVTISFNSFRIISSVSLLGQPLFAASTLHTSIGLVTFLTGLLMYNYFLSIISRRIV